MTTPATISQLGEHTGSRVEITGWLYGKRRGGKIIFLEVRDGTGICQCVVEAGTPDAFDLASGLNRESSIRLQGTVRDDSRSEGGYEISVDALEVVHAGEEYPITPKAHGVDFLMSHRHLWLRSRRPHAILRIRHTIIRSIRDFFDSRGFTLVDTPILTQGAGEDEQTLFSVDYFDEDAFLTQTGQLHLESACMALRKVYCFGPTFRAEKSKTRRHLTEFWMVEPEIAFADLDDLLELAEDLVCAIVEAVLAKNTRDLETLGRDIEPLQRIRKPFRRMTYDEAAALLRSTETRDWMLDTLQENRRQLEEAEAALAQLEADAAEARKAWQQEKIRNEMAAVRETIHDLRQEVENAPRHLELAQSFAWGKDLGGSDETILANRIDQPLFVTHYPAAAKAFYMKRDPHNDKVVLNMDLLAPEGYGEIIGGSQREDHLETLAKAIEAKGLNPEDYGWYMDLRRYGSVPHGGFGLGIERTLTWICGLKHVRETIPFPRTMGRIFP